MITASLGSAGIWSILGIGLVFGAFYLTGRLLPARSHWESPLLGWSGFYLLSLVTTLSGLSDLRVALAILAFAVVATLTLRRVELPKPPRILFFTAAAALLALSVFTPPVYWDSYAHWLPNSAYLFQLDHFPRSPLGNFPSLHPTYPPALPLVIYAGSRLTGHFAELGASVLNVLLSLVVMSAVTHLLRQSIVAASEQNLSAPLYRYGIPLLAFCMVIPLNPAIELQHFWSVIADPPLGVVIFIAILAWCRFMAGAQEAERFTSIAVTLFLLGALIGGLKPSAWLLCFMVSASCGLVAILLRIPVKRWFMPTLALASGGFAAVILWKIYLALHLPIADQFSIQPLHAWRFDLAEEMVRSIVRDFRTHWIYWPYAGLTVAVGLISLLRRATLSDPTTRLLVGVTSVAMLLHVASLLAAYLGTGFDVLEIRQAACFQRYSSQVGYALCVSGLVAFAQKGLAARAGRLPSLTTAQVTAWGVTACAVLFLALTVRPTLALAVKADRDEQRRKLALEALKTVPGGTRVAVIGDRWSLNFLRYESWVDLRADERPRWIARHQVVRADTRQSDQALLERWTCDPNIDAILLVDAREFARQSGLNIAPDQIWRRDEHAWRVLRLPRLYGRARRTN
jgi:hypothetical protein